MEGSVRPKISSVAKISVRAQMPATPKISDRPKIVVVCGPTATGKTGLALSLARIFNGELVSADSMQVYKGLVVGTAALLPRVAKGVPLHLTGFLPPEQRFTVAEYTAAASATLADIAARHALPVVCGGTGLYIKSLLEGVHFAEDEVDIDLRAELETQWDKEGGEAMLAQLSAVDRGAADKLHANDRKRILRALEAYTLSGKTLAQRNASSKPARPPFDAYCIGLATENRQVLYCRIEARVDAMMREGLLDEARMVYDNRQSYQTAAQAIGYKEFFAYFEGAETLENCVAALKQSTRRYAKRQLTWFNRMNGIHWLDAESETLLDDAQKMVRGFLNDSREVPDG